MNEILVKRLGFLTLGAIIGGVAGYFLSNLIIEKLEDRLRDEEIQEAFAKEAERVRRKNSSEQGHPELKEESSLKLPSPIKAIHGQRASRNYTDYSKKDKGDLNKLVEPYVANQKIGVVSIREWSEDAQFDKEPITYYEDDVTYCDVNEEIIADPNGLFGPNVHLHFGEGSEDPDIVYVRNEKNSTDYEISRVHNAYSVVVLGMPQEEKKPSKSARRRNARKVTEEIDNEIDDKEED